MTRSRASLAAELRRVKRRLRRAEKRSKELAAKLKRSEAAKKGWITRRRRELSKEYAGLPHDIKVAMVKEKHPAFQLFYDYLDDLGYDEEAIFDEWFSPEEK